MKPISLVPVMLTFCLIVFMSLLAIPVFASEVPERIGLTYSGNANWDDTTKTLTFLSTGAMPDGREEFFWSVPLEVSRIQIEQDVTVTGGFRVGLRPADQPLHLEGADRKTSVIHGTEMQKWTEQNKIPENSKWKYGAVNVLGDAVVHISHLTSRNPRGYNISGYANRSVIHVSDCDLLDTRTGDNNNSDGFIGAAGSSIKDSLISTSDDAIKVYHDITIENVTIEQRRNGAPLQLGWGGETGTAIATIRNLVIRGVDPEHRYNMAPITWVNGTRGTRGLKIDGLKVAVEGERYNSTDGLWEPVGLLALMPPGCTVNVEAKNAEITVSGPGVQKTQGIIHWEARPSDHGQ